MSTPTKRQLGALVAALTPEDTTAPFLVTHTIHGLSGNIVDPVASNAEGKIVYNKRLWPIVLEFTWLEGEGHFDVKSRGLPVDVFKILERTYYTIASQEWSSGLHLGNIRARLGDHFFVGIGE